MKQDEFVAAVARRTGLSGSDALRVTRSVLHSLSERIGPHECRALARELGARLADALALTERPEHFDLHELVQRVQVRTGTTRRELALAWVAAVGMTLGERVHATTLTSLRDALPAPIAFLLRPMGD